jgi:Spy/CpxP family protein refolding chaperone
MKFRKLPLGEVLTAALFFAAPAFAQDAGQPEYFSQTPDIAESELYVANMPPPPGGPGSHAGCPLEGLGLSDDQLEKLSSIRSQYEINTAQKKAELHAKSHQMMDLLSQASVDKQKVMSLQGEINAMKSDVSNSRAAMLVDCSAVLTADQKKQLHHMMLMHGLMMGGHDKGGHHMQWHHH